MKRLSGAEFTREYRQRESIDETNEQLDLAVLDIISNVRKRGDEAVRQYTKEFDGIDLAQFIVTEEEIVEAKAAVSETFLTAIQNAYANIYAFHAEQKEKSWFVNGQDDIMLGQKVTPIPSVGIYVPGGKASYPSTVLMNATPASIAGVKRIVMVTPPQADGKINPHVLVAASIAGVHTIYKVGGAQAVAALAYGTETIQKVEKIVGPGNAFVARAKKWVYGDVAIDMIAGPSEICVVADDTANAKFAAADLLSQAEHDEQATAICITTSEAFAEELAAEIVSQTAQLERKAIIEVSLEQNGKIIKVDTIEEAMELVNIIAPEHLQLMIENPMEQMQAVENAGAIFLGNYSPEALGDYYAGPNHTLPTSGTSTFSSPLGVYDFFKKSSIIYYSETAFQKAADDIITIANAEGLTGHANSIAIRKVE